MRSNHRRTAVLVALGLFLVPVAAHADDLTADLEKLLKDGTARFAKALSEKIDATLAEAQKGFVEAVGGLVEKHVAGLRKEVADRDKKISELEARIKRLEGQLAGAGTKPTWPSENLTRAYLGIGHTDLPGDLAGQLKVSQGALVTDVLDGTPAAAAGLQKGDVIVDVDGKPVDSVSLSTAIRTFKPGSKVKIAYFRGGERAQADVSLVDKDEFWARRVEKPQPVVLGVLVAEQDGGLVVKEVEDGFTGSVAGLKVDDRLLKINGADVKTLEEIASALGKVQSGDRLEFSLERGGEGIAVAVLGSHEKGKAKVVEATKAAAPEEKVAKEEEKKEEKKPEQKEPPKEVVQPEKKSAYLGIDVVDDPDGPAVISAVLPDTTASAYGLKVGDVFKKLNGQDVATTSALVAAVGALSPGDKISLVVSRDGKDVEVGDVLVGAPGQKIAAPKRPGSIGIIAAEADGGIKIQSLIDGGAAGEAGLKAGDVIVAANGKEVKSFSDFGEALGGLFAGDVVSLKIRRGDEVQEVQVTLAVKSS